MQMKKCTFSICLASIRTTMKYSVFGWRLRAEDNTVISESNELVRLVDGRYTFNQTLNLCANLAFDMQESEFKEKIVRFQVYSCLESKPSVVKSSAQMNINLAEIANNQGFSTEQEYLLKGELKNMHAALSGTFIGSVAIYQNQKEDTNIYITKMGEKDKGLAKVERRSGSSARKPIQTKKNEQTDEKRNKTEHSIKQSNPRFPKQLKTDGSHQGSKEDLINQNKQLKIQLEAAEQNFKDLQEGYVKLEALINEKDNQMYVLHVEIESLREKNLEFARNGRVSSYSETKYQAELEDLQTKLEASQFKCAELELKLIESKAQFQDLNSDMAALRSKNEQVSATFQSVRKQKKQIEAKLTEELRKAKISSKNSENLAKQSKQTVERQQKELKEIREQILKWESGFEEQERKIAITDKKIREHETKCRQHSKNEQNAQSEYQKIVEKHLQKELAMKKNLQIIEEETNNVYNILQQKQINEQKLIQVLNQREHELEELREIVTTYEKLLAAEKEKNVNLENEILSSLSTPKCEDSPAFDQNQMLIEKNHNLLSALNDSVQKLIEHEKVKRECQKLKKFLEEKNIKIVELQDQFKQHKQKINYLMKENKKLIEGNNKLGNDINKYLQHIRALEDQVSKLKAANFELEELNQEKQFKLARLKSQEAGGSKENGIASAGNTGTESNEHTVSFGLVGSGQQTAKGNSVSVEDKNNSLKNQQIKALAQELRDLISKRQAEKQVSGIFTQIISRANLQSDLIQPSNLHSFQEKVRTLSKQATKFKATLFKSKSKSLNERSQLAYSLKPMQSIIHEISSICQKIVYQIGSNQVSIY